MWEQVWPCPNRGSKFWANKRCSQKAQDEGILNDKCKGRLRDRRDVYKVGEEDTWK